jgi:xanthine dehydrogenase YagS FAD-binding subunit
MKNIANSNARAFGEAVTLYRQAAAGGRAAAFAGGGSDLLGLVKDGVATPDVIVNLRTVGEGRRIESADGGLAVGGLATLDEISRHPEIRRRYPVLAEAAGSVATPQIRNVATLAGNVCQRPWCWYFRNGFPCFKAGGRQCFSPTGENQFHAIFGGGPSYIVHPSDVAAALAALDATFRVVGPAGARTLPAADFFVLPRQNPARENVLADDELLVGVSCPGLAAGARSTYHKIMDREAWTHAVVSAAVVLEMDGEVCRRAAVVLGGVAPIPWRVPAVERLLAGRRVTPALAAEAGEAAVADATPLPKNRYKVPLTRTMVERTILQLAGS